MSARRRNVDAARGSLAAVSRVLSSPPRRSRSSQLAAELPRVGRSFCRATTSTDVACGTALSGDDPTFSWDTHFGGDIDLVDYVRRPVDRSSPTTRPSSASEFRPFDPNQAAYLLEASARPGARAGRSWRRLQPRVAPPQRSAQAFAVAWNIARAPRLQRSRCRHDARRLAPTVGVVNVISARTSTTMDDRGEARARARRSAPHVARCPGLGCRALGLSTRRHRPSATRSTAGGSRPACG